MIAPPPSDQSKWGYIWLSWLSGLFHWIEVAATPGSVTLTANVGTTTVTNTHAKTTSTIILFPTTSTAATEFGAGTLYTSTKSDGSFVITHINNAVATRTFDYLIINR